MPLDILVVDDDADLLSILSELLDGYGYRVRATRSGQDAIASMVDQVARVVIIDDEPQDFSATNLVAHLRAVAEVRRLDGYLTAIAMRSDLVIAGDPAAEGFDHILLKPVAYEKLLALLAELAPGHA